jgi:hypothetical protein
VAYSSTLKMEAVCTSQASVNLYRTTQCHIPEHSIVNLLSSIITFSYIMTSRIWGSVTNNNGFWIGFFGTFISLS